jgi:surface antigen
MFNIAKNRKHYKNTAVFAVILTLFTIGAAVPIVQADQFESQIRALQAENANKQKQVSQLKVEANGLQATIAALQVQIDALQAQISANKQKGVELEQKIAEAEAELQRQRDLLGQNIKAMYLEGDISTIEMLATSRNLSEFFDKQQYRDSVKDKIKSTLDKVNALKAQLKDQKEELEKLIAEQEVLQAQVAAQQAQQQYMLSLNQGQRAALDQEIKSNFVKVAELRRLQAIENARLFGNGNIPAGIPGGGGYPGVWAFAPIDSMLDNWGMYNRECVSFTAWKVAISGRYMPGWGWIGRGNANQWDDNARAAGIPVDGAPRVGDVAVSNAGFYGHVMYVEVVASDGAIYVSDYNQQFDGLYREYWISAANVSARGLVFIHF